ncbi:MAG: protocatechuate 3,4-dioxygenase subunit alpha [Actinomycetota bacterium]|nr:protocatechuate 3,4-dioxygenase subunit alpha [Actinomycetota bacterium]
MPAQPPPTPSQTVGPFFHGALSYGAGPRLVDPSRPDAIRLSGVVRDGAGDPVPDGLVEIWQAGLDGTFPTATNPYAEPGAFRGFGRCATDDGGAYGFVTLKPGEVPTTDGTPQAPHIAMSVFARGLLQRLVTRVYFTDETAANATDPLLRLLGTDRAATLLAGEVPGGYRFDVRMQGEQETVFLDVFGG